MLRCSWFKLRVIGSSTLCYTHNDHLGTTALSNGAGVGVAGSATRYAPFGSYRGTPPTQTLTDRDFTSQKHNRDLGLIYYNARYYAPGFGRFISADTIVPDPTNPQGYNRYSYAYNNPLRFADPTGHRPDDGCEFEGCELPTGMDMDYTWQLPDGALIPWDPILSAKYPGASIPEIVGFAAVGLTAVAAAPAVIEYALAEVAWPAIAKVGSSIASWLCLDGDCYNEARVTYDATLRAGTGQTDMFGNIRISSLGSTLERAQVLYHEQVHAIFTPRGPFQEIRAIVSQWAYNNSSLLRYTEEALAESVAQMQTGGSLQTGLLFPITHGYVSPLNVVLETGVLSGGTIWTGLQLGNFLERWVWVE